MYKGRPKTLWLFGRPLNRDRDVFAVLPALFDFLFRPFAACQENAVGLVDVAYFFKAGQGAGAVLSGFAGSVCKSGVFFAFLCKT